MSEISVQMIDQGQLDRATRLLAGIENGIETATRDAMRRATSFIRTDSGKAIRTRYDISQSALRPETNIRVSYSYRDGISAFVHFAGYKIPLYRYNGASPTQPTGDKSEWVNAMIGGQWRRVHPGLAASGHQLLSTSPERFDHAFVARMGSSHTGIFARTGGTSRSGGDEITEVMGKSVPQMLGGKEVSDAILRGAAEKFNERLEHEATRLLNGWEG